ncbi:hypothetical protein DYQ86_17760 [Acidobacteria bacterium AB60]|nr:hypothetical protein DYQ86_17760 [Acidobacteria bacterium AB60]
MADERTLKHRCEAQKKRIEGIVVSMYPGGGVFFDPGFEPEAIAFSIHDAKGNRIAHFPGGTAVDGLERMTDEEIGERIRQDIRMRVH